MLKSHIKKIEAKKGGTHYPLVMHQFAMEAITIEMIGDLFLNWYSI